MTLEQLIRESQEADAAEETENSAQGEQDGEEVGDGVVQGGGLLSAMDRQARRDAAAVNTAAPPRVHSVPAVVPKEEAVEVQVHVEDKQEESNEWAEAKAAWEAAEQDLGFS